MVENAKKSTIVVRGSATKAGRFNFFFKEANGGTLYANKNWFTGVIPIGATYADVANMLINEEIYTYSEILQPYAPEPDPIWWVQGWPEYKHETTGQVTPILLQTPTYEISSDLFGEKLVITMYTDSGVRFRKYEKVTDTTSDRFGSSVLVDSFGDVDVSMQQDEDLEGFGSLEITSDYTVYITSPKLSQCNYDATLPQGLTEYNSLNFLIDSWLSGVNSSAKEDLGVQAPYFRIPVYNDEGLEEFNRRIQYGDDGTTVGKPVVCASLSDQINTYFNRVALATNLLETDSFTVISDVSDLRLTVNISTMSNQIQHQVSCYTYGAPEINLQTLCNSYFIDDNIFELRSYYDMYGIDKPMGIDDLSQTYKPLAYGFKFNLDYITEYSETESSAIDVTPIPGQSSAKAIGIDATGCIRDITISGIRVDNSNIWMFHVPWEEMGLNQGIIYTGTSNWGWVKFMKGILGTFQMTSGPYRLVMMTVPSSSQMQYYPTRQGVYQYSDGTIVLLAGWEDMCYVMVENFTYSRSEEMFNAIQYNLKMKRVTPLMANRG